ncbi:DnaA/Hda family protein [Mycoplasma sp. 744]|uniref:DnaA ATPase domain-containing protein n=1 Tax=Mycoplasma sp. 744 TaxID=3108531 RepID=UPI002B1CE7C2|nr:DnaA/Hda family protein [Mycoplasma sp. 744]MEA4115293.1 DnaA/Hda family protein [Mycoplasma sp. 744]
MTKNNKVSDFVFQELNNNSEYYNDIILNFFHNDPIVSKLIEKYNITNAEILQYTGELISIVSKKNNNEHDMFNIQIFRDQNNNLILKKYHQPSRKLIREKSLRFTSIDNPNPNCLRSKIIFSADKYGKNKQDIVNNLNYYNNILDNKKEIRDLFIYSKKSNGKSYLLQAIANYFARRYKLTAYLKYDNWKQFISEWIFQKESTSELIKKFVELDVLVIDDLNSIKNTFPFILEFICNVLKQRKEKNKFTIVGSLFSINEIEKHLSKTNYKDPILLYTFFNILKRKTIEYEI